MMGNYHVRFLEGKGAVTRLTYSAIDTKFGTKSKYSIKEPQRIVEKATRLSIIRIRPWFGIEHVTDTFRFQTIVSNLNVVPKIVQELKIAGVEVIRTNGDTMLKPTRFGWRMITLDLRFKNRQIIEYQILVEDMAAANVEGHKIFEKWRDKDLSQLNGKQRAEYAKDRRESKNIYSKAWQAYVQRTSQTDNQVASILIELHNAISNN